MKLNICWDKTDSAPKQDEIRFLGLAENLDGRFLLGRFLNDKTPLKYYWDRPLEVGNIQLSDSAANLNNNLITFASTKNQDATRRD